MARSVKKGPYVVDSLVKKVESMNRSGEKRVLKTWARRSASRSATRWNPAPAPTS